MEKGRLREYWEACVSSSSTEHEAVYGESQKLEYIIIAKSPIYFGMRSSTCKKLTTWLLSSSLGLS